MKKILASILGLGALVLMSGCGPTGPNVPAGSQEKTGHGQTLNVWQDPGTSKGNRPAFKAFEKKYNVKIKVRESTYVGQLQSVQLDGPAGTGPDVFLIPNSNVTTAVAQGIVRPLTVDKQYMKQFTPSAVDAVTYNKHVYGIPYSEQTNILFYNKKLVPGKVPTSMNEWYSLSETLRKQGKYGLLAPFDQLYYALGVIQPYGGYLFKQNADGSYDPNNIGINNAGANQAVTYLSKWYKQGLIPKGMIGDQGVPQMDSLFSNGKVAAVVSGPWNFNVYKEAGVNYGVTELPLLPNGKRMNSMSTVKCLVVSAYSKNGALAEKLIKFMQTYKNAKTYYETTGETPTLNKLLNSDTLQNDPHQGPVVRQMGDAISTPNIQEFSQTFWTTSDATLQSIMSGKSAPKPALNSGVSTIKQQITAAKQ